MVVLSHSLCCASAHFSGKNREKPGRAGSVLVNRVLRCAAVDGAMLCWGLNSSLSDSRSAHSPAAWFLVIFAGSPTSATESCSAGCTTSRCSPFCVSALASSTDGGTGWQIFSWQHLFLNWKAETSLRSKIFVKFRFETSRRQHTF